MTVECEHCLRDVPVAPGHFKVSSPHVEPCGDPCIGNTKRQWRDGGLVHGAIRLAQQYAILDDNAYWEGL